MPIGGMSNRRGLNVVIIDTSMGQVLSAKTYDSWAYAWVHRLTGHSPVQLTDLTVFPGLRNCWGDSDLALRQWHSQQRTVRHTIYLCDSHASFFFLQVQTTYGQTLETKLVAAAGICVARPGYLGKSNGRKSATGQRFQGNRGGH